MVKLQALFYQAGPASGAFVTGFLNGINAKIA